MCSKFRLESNKTIRKNRRKPRSLILSLCIALCIFAIFKKTRPDLPRHIKTGRMATLANIAIHIWQMVRKFSVNFHFHFMIFLPKRQRLFWTIGNLAPVNFMESSFDYKWRIFKWPCHFWSHYLKVDYYIYFFKWRLFIKIRYIKWSFHIFASCPMKKMVTIMYIMLKNYTYERCFLNSGNFVKDILNKSISSN